MDDELKRLLDAEARAEAMVDATQRECERLIEQTREEVQAAERRAEEHMPELRKAFVDRADERAGLTLAEMERHYRERGERLQAMASARAQEAVDATLALIVDPDWE